MSDGFPSTTAKFVAEFVRIPSSTSAESPNSQEFGYGVATVRSGAKKSFSIA
jgi:hypothetical protein